MSYTESSNVINLTNALPMADNDGKLQTDYFDFSITSNADTNADDNEGITIPYKLIIQERNIDNDKIQLRDNQIKVYLTKIESGIEIPVIGPTLISNLDKKDTNYNLYITNNTHKNNIGKITTNYRLRAWIDMNVDANLFNENNYQYKFSINVNSNDKNIVTYKLGDVNGDGKINATDAVQISMFANNKSKLDPIYVLHVGDVNGDGKADVNDSELITKYSSGYITTFPAGEPLEERSYEISDKITITYKLGDVNNDGKILANDGALILRHASNQTEYDPRYVEYSGDVNGDGTADESDSTLINEYVNSKITTFPAGTPLEERTYEAQVK